MTSPVLYAICCAAPPVLHAAVLAGKARDRGWDVCVICTPTAARWLHDDVPELEKLTGHPVRSHYKLPTEPDALPAADAILVAPATSNTISKWALGISDTLALGLITEAIGKQLPLAALPYLNVAQAAHPAFARHLDVLRAAGVAVLLGQGGYTPHEPKQGNASAFPWDAALDELGRRMPAKRGS